MIGPEKFVAPVQQLLPCVQFCTPTPMQEALSSALSQADAPYEGYTRYPHLFLVLFSKFSCVTRNSVFSAATTSG